MTIDCYLKASDYLGKKTDRPLPGRSSRLIRRDDSTIAVRYHSTDVVTYHADETITLRTGGWYLLTTKERINEYTRARVYADKGTWYLMDRNRGWEIAKHERLLFVDGMKINIDGMPLTPTYPEQADVDRKRKLDRAVSNYIKGFSAHISAHGLENPSNGDCFGCLFSVAGEQVTQGAMRRENMPTMHGRTEPMGVDHYLSHFEESYFVPSLLFNAIKARGYRDPGFIWAMIQGRKDGKHAAMILRQYFKTLKPALLESLK